MWPKVDLVAGSVGSLGRKKTIFWSVGLLGGLIYSSATARISRPLILNVRETHKKSIGNTLKHIVEKHIEKHIAH